MDSHLVWFLIVNLEVRECKGIRQGDLVAVATEEDGSEGVLFGTKDLFHNRNHKKKRKKSFLMNSEVSREKPVDYQSIYDGCFSNREHGYIAWVVDQHWFTHVVKRLWNG